jgi:hypothetical protein
MSSANGNSPDLIGKVFVVRRRGLLECFVCGELFTRRDAPEHAEVDCRPAVEFCLLEPVGRKKQKPL